MSFKFAFKKILFYILIISIFSASALSIIAVDIFLYSQNKSEKSADAVIVMGAAAWGTHPSPVYRERLNEAIELYKKNRVKKMIFTGGTRDMHFPSESKVAFDYAVKQGVKSEDIYVESSSHSTLENLIESKKIINRNGIANVLVVTDPLHMKRSMFIANELQIDASPYPCEASRFQSFSSQLKLLIHETWALAEHLVIRYLVTLIW
jgi:uncharacterized SAM-binding protein YcdF (DUF218 family)